VLQLPIVARPVVSLKLPTFYVRSISVKIWSRLRDNTYHCKDVGIIFGNPQRADRTIELVHKLDGIGSWIDLPDLRFVNQSDQDLTIGPDRYVFDPLKMISSAEDLTNHRRGPVHATPTVLLGKWWMVLTRASALRSPTTNPSTAY